MIAMVALRLRHSPLTRQPCRAELHAANPTMEIVSSRSITAIVASPPSTSGLAARPPFEFTHIVGWARDLLVLLPRTSFRSMQLNRFRQAAYCVCELITGYFQGHWKKFLVFF